MQKSFLFTICSKTEVDFCLIIRFFIIFIQFYLNLCASYGIINVLTTYLKGCFSMLLFLLSTIENQEDKLIFEEIYRKYQAASMRRALKMLNDNRFDAEDAFQKAWIQIAQHLSELKTRDDAAIATYIMKTIEYKSIDVANENKSYRAELEPEEMNPDEYVSDDMMHTICSRERYAEIVETLRNMDNKYRDILIFHYLQGFDIKSIAEQLNLNEKTVWTRLYRGKAILVNALKEKGFGN